MIDFYYKKYLEICKAKNISKDEIKSEEEFCSSGLRKEVKAIFFARIYGMARSAVESKP
jgi:hypothetical protein